MALEKKTGLYEILIRFGLDGEVAGAHVKDVTAIVDTETGELHSATEGEPRPITAKECAKLLGKRNAELLEHNQRLKAELATQQHGRELAESERDALRTENERMIDDHRQFHEEHHHGVLQRLKKAETERDKHAQRADKAEAKLAKGKKK